MLLSEVYKNIESKNPKRMRTKNGRLKLLSTIIR